MKHLHKSLLLVMIALITTMSLNLVLAQPPAIGSTAQLAPFESSPTADASDKTGGGAVTNPTNAYDKDWSVSFASIPLVGNALFPPDTAARYFALMDFETPSAPGFDPGWVDIKLRYSCPATTDDAYRIVYQVSPDTTSYVLKDWVSGAAAAVSVATDVIAWDFHDIAEPNDTTWDWTDVSNLIVRIETQQTSGSDAKIVSLYEVWAAVYPAPKPPTSSTAISIQPSAVMDARAGGDFFIDVYVCGLTGGSPGLQSFTINMEYDTALVTAVEWFAYHPFVSFVGGGIDDAAGQLSIGYLTFFGDTVGYQGTDTAILRIYFVGDAAGTCDLTITLGELKEIGADLPYYPTTHDGWVSLARVMSYQGSTLPDGDPTGSMWHELYPDYCKMWELTSWEDNPHGTPDNKLSVCDQIDMTNETGWKYWFHVVEVTLTVHWEYKPTPSGELGAGEPKDIPEYGLPAWDPDLPPVGYALHEIYPTFCRGIYISGWSDTDGSGTLTPSDQMTITYTDDFSSYEVHITDITTDIWISEKPIPAEPPEVPEFPFGLGIVMMIAAAIPIVYLWSRKRSK